MSCHLNPPLVFAQLTVICCQAEGLTIHGLIGKPSSACFSCLLLSLLLVSSEETDEGLLKDPSSSLTKPLQPNVHIFVETKTLSELF